MADEPNTPDQQPPDSPIKGSEALYQLAVWSVILAGPLLAAILALLISALTEPILGTAVAAAWLIAWLAYVLTSFQIVQENEAGGIFVLQNPAREVEPGLRFAPRFITELNKLPLTSQQNEFPDNPENVSKRDDAEGLPPGMKRPLRVTTDGIEPSEAGLHTDPLKRRLTLELQVVVVWRLAKGRFFDMWNRLPESRGSSRFARLIEQMYDSVDVQVTEKVSQVTPAELLKNFASINEKIATELQNDLGRWGVEIERAHLKSPDIPKDVNDALAAVVAGTATAQRDVIAAEGAKRATQLAAEGERYRIEQIAEARKTEERLRGEGQRAAADALGVDGEQYFVGHVLTETVGEGSVIITGSGGMTDLLALGEALKKKGGQE